MRVLLVGKGGREAALAWRIAQSPQLTELLVLGHNPGWPESAVELPVDTDVVATAKERFVDLVVVGPEGPLEAGLADALLRADIPCFGPVRGAAKLETSKAFAKKIMAHAGVQTAGYVVVDRDDAASVAEARRRCAKGSVAIKVDGLAAGKGVFVCHSPEEALAGLEQAWSGRFGEAARFLVLEDLLVGPEVSLFALCDGEHVVALPTAQDHKRLGDGDVGPNTGGMGAYAPCPLIDAETASRLVQTIHLPVVRELASRNIPYRGVLYAGLMLTDSGPQLLEFNVRFGDPECQALMALWQGDILPWLFGAASGRLPDGQPTFADGAACCVVLASGGYPMTSTKGVAIAEPDDRTAGVEVFHAGTRRDRDGVLRTNGGRVLGITGVGEDFETAAARAYAELDHWRFEGCQYRTDIGP